jgi:hypothetical protein
MPEDWAEASGMVAPIQAATARETRVASFMSNS